MDDEILKKFAYVISSKHRVRVMNGFNGNVYTPTEMSREIGIKPKYVSHALQELKGKELVECINDEYRKGRIYRLTNDGEEVMKVLEEFKE